MVYETVLFPADGSKQSNRAKHMAYGLAETFDAEVYVLSVLDSVDADSPNGEERHRRLLESIEIEGVQRGIEVHTRACYGDPYEEIVQTADEVDADLVVVGFDPSSTESEGCELPCNFDGQARPQTLLV